jgi:hypothetical protein
MTRLPALLALTICCLLASACGQGVEADCNGDTQCEALSATSVVTATPTSQTVHATVGQVPGAASVTLSNTDSVGHPVHISCSGAGSAPAATTVTVASRGSASVSVNFTAPSAAGTQTATCTGSSSSGKTTWVTFTISVVATTGGSGGGSAGGSGGGSAGGSGGGRGGGSGGGSAGGSGGGSAGGSGGGSAGGSGGGSAGGSGGGRGGGSGGGSAGGSGGGSGGGSAGGSGGGSGSSDGAPTRTATCTPTSQETGTAINTTHGRLDGYLRYVVPLGGSSSCNGDSGHIHLQISVNNAIYDVAVDVGRTNGDSNSYEANMPMPDGAWSEGWHDDAFSYTALGLKSSQFTSENPTSFANRLTSELTNVNHISVFGIAYSSHNGAHDIHYYNGNDGALVLEPLSASPRILFFRFATQSF